MKPEDDDRALRELFGELRSQDQNHAPRFRMMWPPPNAHRPGVRRLRLIIASAAAAALVLGIYLSVRMRPSSRPVAELQLSTWKAPTDFLLKIPGSGMLSELPKVPSLPKDDILQSALESKRKTQ